MGIGYTYTQHTPSVCGSIMNDVRVVKVDFLFCCERYISCYCNAKGASNHSCSFNLIDLINLPVNRFVL